jgi:hypothetical protein
LRNIIKLSINTLDNSYNTKLILKDTFQSFTLYDIDQISSNEYLFSGVFFDSLFIFNKKYNTNVYSDFIFSDKQFLKPLIRTISKNNNISCTISQMIFNNNFYYVAGYVSGEISINGTITNNSSGLNFFAKLDQLGNILWFVRYGNNTYSTTQFSMCKLNKDFYLISNFMDSVILDTVYYNIGNRNSSYISKIHDYSITRGIVSSGPYCAGDNILVPYTTDGSFESDNQFIAELSDENGNFDGFHRELGRIYARKDSFITGQLPLFDVQSSPNYRIRILSTHPPIQSYYRYDTLRLLIYSKDTANADSDTNICYGQTLQLKTSGGSKWRWSPGYLLEDSAVFNPFTKPISTNTQFRIIISDSSGCGKTDTAYKWVLPYQPLKIYNTDTIVCQLSALIHGIASGGNPLYHPYSFKWFNTKDSLLFIGNPFPFDNNSPDTLKIVLSDNCSVFIDSCTILIKRFEPLKLKPITDTVFCQALPIRIPLSASGGNGNYQFSIDQNINHTFITKDSLLIHHYGSLNTPLKVNDFCSSHIDSQLLHIQVHEPLVIDFHQRFKLCFGDTLSTQANVVSGIKNGPFNYLTLGDHSVSSKTIFNKIFHHSDSIICSAKDLCNNSIYDTSIVEIPQALNIYNIKDSNICHQQIYRFIPRSYPYNQNTQYDWKFGGNSIKTATHIDSSFLVDAVKTFKLFASDGCSKNDSVTFTLSPLKAIQTQITQSPYCFKDTVFLKATISGGKPTQYELNWKDENNFLLGTGESLIYDSKNKLQNIYFLSSDNCSPSHADSIRIKPMTIAEFGINKNTQCLNNNLYEIHFKGNKLKSNLDSIYFQLPNHQYEKTDTFFTQFHMDTVGKFNVKSFTLSNDKNCSDSTHIAIEVLNNPQVEVTWTRTTLTFDKSTWKFTAQANSSIAQYDWQIEQFPLQHGSSITQEFEKEGPIKIHLKAIDRFNCEFDSTYSFDLKHRVKFFIPNAITLNNDNINDCFSIPGSEYMQDYHLQIFNRWGEKVFDSNNPLDCFQPKDNGNNVYIYKLNILDIYNERHLLNGSFVCYW